LSARQEDAVSVGEQVGIADPRQPIDGRKNTSVTTGMTILMLFSLLFALYSLQQSILSPHDNNNDNDNDNKTYTVLQFYD